MASPSGSEQLSQLLQSLESLVSIHLNTAREVRRFTGGTLPDQVRSIWHDYLVRLRRLEGLIAGTLPECATTIRPPLPSSHPLPPAPKIDDAEHERRLLRLILFETVKADVADPGQDLVALRAVAVRCKGPLDGLWGCKVQRSGRSTFILLAKGRALVRRLREASGDGARGMRETVASMPDVAPLLTRGAYSLDAQSSLSVIMWDDESQVVEQVGGLDSAGTIGRLFARIGQGLLQSDRLGPQLQVDQEATASPFVLIVKPALQESEVCLFDHQGEVWGLVISKDEPPDEGYRTEAPLTHQPIDGLLLRKQATRVVVVPRRSLEAANLSCLSLKRSPARAEAPAASLPPVQPSPAAAAPPPQAVPQAHASAWPPPVQQPAAQGAVMAQAAGLPAPAAQKQVPETAAAAQAFLGYATSRAGTGSQGQTYPLTMAYPGPSYQQLPPPAAYTVQQQQQQSVSTALPAVSLQGRAISSTTGGKKRPAPIITQQQPALPAGSAGATSTPVGTQRAGTTPASSSSSAGSSAGGRQAGLALSLAMQQQPPGMFLLLSPAQPVVQHLLETVWRFKPWVDGAKAGEGGGGEAVRRLASFLEQEPSVSKVVVLAGPAVPETGEVHLDGASEPGGSLSYENFRSAWVSSASFRTGSARCLVIVDADFSGVWVERLQQEGQDLRLGVQAACGAQQRRAPASPSFFDLLADFNRATSEAEEKAWRAQLSRLAHSGHLPCAFVQGAVPGQKTYSFASPRVRLMGGASLIEEEQQQSPTQGGSAGAVDVCNKARPAEGGSAVQLDPGASAFLEFAMTAHQLQPSSPPLGPDGATTTTSGSPTTSTSTKPGRKRKAGAESSSPSPPSSVSGVSKASRTTSSPSRSSAAGTGKKRAEAEKGEAAAEGKGGAKAGAKGAKKKGEVGSRQGGGDCGEDPVAMDEGEGLGQHGDIGMKAEGGHDCDGDEDGGTKSPVGSEQSSTTRSDTTDSRLGHRESGESEEGDDDEEEEELDGPAGGAGPDVGLERLWHGHKQDLFAYLLKTCPPGTFAVPSLDALLAEVEDANQRFNGGGRPFDAHEFRAQLEQAGGSSQVVPLLEVLKGEERASSQVLKKMGGGRAWAWWFLTRAGRQDFPTRQELHRIQEFLRRHKCYEPLEKALRRGQKTKLSRRLHEACPFLFLDDKLDAHLQHMRNLPQHDRALMQKQVLDVVGRFSRTEVWAVLQALESGVLLYVQGKAWPNTGLMAYWTETNGAWQLAEHLSGISFSRQGETIYRGDAMAGLIEQQQQQQQQQDYKTSPPPPQQRLLLQPPALIPIEPVASNIEMVDAATQAQSPQQQQRQLMSLPAGPQQQQPPPSHQQQQEAGTN